MRFGFALKKYSKIITLSLALSLIGASSAFGSERVVLTSIGSFAGTIVNNYEKDTGNINTSSENVSGGAENIEVVKQLRQETYIEKTLELINNERAKNSLSPLKLNDKLCGSAQQYAEYMYKNDYFDHTSKEGSTSYSRISATIPDLLSTGENIGSGFKNPNDVVSAWMNSKMHRGNILNASYEIVGIGYCEGYWVMDFGGYTS
ncbi:MAG: CAP domain-containing protein [Firmicutes bacterium]|nr:CAP domain-containing protein [Bacillota bacterium]